VSKQTKWVVHNSKLLVAALAAFGFSCNVGCEPAATKSDAGKQTAATEKKDDHGHSHAHDHGDHGEHGGHLVHLEPSGGHAEWSHDDDKGIVTVYVEEIVSGGAKVEGVRIDLEVGTNPKKSYNLETSSDEHKIENSVFSITSPELVTALGVSEGVKATLVVVVDGKEQSCKLEHDHGHDHGHDH
jgi:hypothetical protein